MDIIKRGTVERGIGGTWWLYENVTSIARLSGDWAEVYEGRELAIVGIDKPIDILFDIIAEMQSKKEKAEILNGKEEG